MQVVIKTIVFYSIIPFVQLFLVVLYTVQSTVNKKYPDDSELVKQFKNGNEWAFSQLVEKYQKKIYYLARRMVMNHLDADDVVQETFIKVFRNSPFKKNRSCLPPFLTILSLGNAHN